jgi:DNA repair photolyase
MDVEDDGWNIEEESRPVHTTVTVEKPKTIISYNKSPDIPFESSINPYRGCEHGYIYCYARPSHAYMELAPGIDFETKLFAKLNAVDLLKKEIIRPHGAR